MILVSALILSISPLSAGAVAVVDPTTLIVGDTVYFGRYPQTLITNTTGMVEGVDYVRVGTRSYKIEPIQWIVFDTDGDGPFLFSKLGLEYRVWHTTANSQVTWADSNVRAWLNSTFFNQAFSSSDQSMIATSEVVTPDTLPANEGGTVFPGGPDTLDKVFLLSSGEIEGATGTGNLFTNNTARRATVTDYVFYSPNGGYRIETWWLRSQGRAVYSAWTINDTAGALLNRNYHNTYTVTRPALDLDLERVYFTAHNGGGFDVNLRSTMTLDPMNGDPLLTEYIVPGEPLTEPVPAPEKDGFAFTGWWTAPEGGTRWDFTTAVEGDLELFAQWAQLYSVIYQTGTSDAVAHMPADEMLTYCAGDAVTISNLTPSRAGYTFKGWTVVGIDPSAVVGGVFTMPATDVVFTAVWEKDVTPPTPGLPPTGDGATLGATAFVCLSGIMCLMGASRRNAH